MVSVPVRREQVAYGPLASATAPDLKALLGIQPSQLLVIDDRPLAADQDQQAAITEPPTLCGQLTQPLAKGMITGPHATVPDHTSISPNQ